MSPDDYLMSELCADYLASPDSPQEGLQRERAVLAVDLLLELHTATAVADFGPKDLRAWQTWLCGLPSLKKAGEKRFSVSTVNYHVDTVRRIWRWGVQAERTTHDRWQALILLRYSFRGCEHWVRQ